MLKAASIGRHKKRDTTPKMKRKHHLNKSFSTGEEFLGCHKLSFILLSVESVYNNNFLGSPTKEGFVMDPMLEHALDFDTDENEEKN